MEGKEDSLTEQEATTLLNDCLRVLYYRDARSLNRVSLGISNLRFKSLLLIRVEFLFQNLILWIQNGVLQNLFVAMVPS